MVKKHHEIHNIKGSMVAGAAEAAGPPSASTTPAYNDRNC